MNTAPYIDPITKDYVLLDGQIENQDTVVTMINMRLNCPLGSYPFDKNFGCQIHYRIGTNSKNVNRRTLEKDIESAVNDMIGLGYLLKFNALCTLFTLVKAEFILFATEINGKEIKFTWSISL